MCCFDLGSFQVGNMQCWNSKFCCRPFCETIASIRIWKRRISNCKPILYWNVRKVSKWESSDENPWPRLKLKGHTIHTDMGAAVFTQTHKLIRSRTLSHILIQSFAFFCILRFFKCQCLCACDFNLVVFVVIFYYYFFFFFLIKWAQCF